MDSRKVLLSAAFAIMVVGAVVYFVSRDGAAPVDAPARGNELAHEDAPTLKNTAESDAQPGEGRPAQVATAQDPTTDEAAEKPEAPLLPVSIAGRVVNSAEKGVPDARVVVFDAQAWDDEVDAHKGDMNQNPFVAIRKFRVQLGKLSKNFPRTQTDEAGEFEVRGLAPGDYRLIVTHELYLPHSTTWVRVKEGAADEADKAVVRVVEAETISGRVVDAQGNPVADAKVSAKVAEIARLRGIGRMVQTFIDQIEGNSFVDTGNAVTGKDGTFQLNSLAPGVYRVKVEKDTYAWAYAEKIPAGAQDIVIGVGRGTRVTARVVDDKKEPVPDASVALRQPEFSMRNESPMAMAMADIDILGDRERQGTTNADGQIELYAFQQGPYEIVVKADGLPTFRKRISVVGEAVDIGELAIGAKKSITGVVVAVGGKPIEGARVRLDPVAERAERRSRGRRPPAADEAYLAVTDARGAFTMEPLAAGKYDLEVTANGFMKARQADVEAGGRELTITLDEGLTIRLRVIDSETGAPVVGARVGERSRVDYRGESNSDGRLEIRGIDKESRDQFVWIHHPDHADWVGRVQAFADDPEKVREIKMEPPSGIAGIVRDENDRPLANARVAVEIPGIPSLMMRMNPSGEQTTAITDASGEFFLAVPPMGRDMAVEVVARHSSYAPARAGPYPYPKRPAKWPDVEIVMSSGSVLTGRVAGPEGQPVSGAQIRARRQTPPLKGEAFMIAQMFPPSYGDVVYSTRDGTYRIPAVEPGTYDFELRATGYARTTVKGVVIGDDDATQDFVLSAGGKLEGRVVTLDEKPFAGAEVVAFLARESAPGLRNREREMLLLGGRGIAQTTTNAEGNFVLSHLPDDEFTIVGRSPGHEPTQIGPVASGEVLPDIVLVPYARISGTVRDRVTMAPVTRYTVRFEVKIEKSYHQRWDYRRQVDSDVGFYEAENISAGAYRLTVKADDYAPAQKQIVLQSGEELTVDFLLGTGAEISGTVREAESDAPVEGATVFVQGKPFGGVSPNGRAQTDAQGAFTIKGLADGDYSLHVNHMEYYLDNSNLVINVPEAAEKTWNVIVRRGGEIAGKIAGVPEKETNETAELALFLVVRITKMDPSGNDGKERHSSIRRIRSDGTFHMGGLRPGTYRIEACRYQRGQPDDQDWRTLGQVEVKAGEKAEFQGRWLGE